MKMVKFGFASTLLIKVVLISKWQHQTHAFTAIRMRPHSLCCTTTTATTSSQLFLSSKPRKKASSSSPTFSTDANDDDDDAFSKSLQDILEAQQDPASIAASLEAATEAPVAPPQEESEADFMARHVSILSSASSASTKDKKGDNTNYNSIDKLLDTDPALRFVSSELGLLELSGQSMDDAAIATSILLERTLDTAEDIMLLLRRQLRMINNKYHHQQENNDKGYNENDTTGAAQATPTTAASALDKTRKKTVVVLGSGWGAHALMKVADCDKVKLIVVSPTNHFVFTPMLASAAVGTVEYRSMTESVRDANPTMEEYIEGKAIDVDVQNKIVKVQLNSLLVGVEDDGARPGDANNDTPSPIIDLPYDHLVVAVGNQVQDTNLPGARERCLRLKSCDDARKLRTAIGEAFEYASRPGLSDEERSRRVTFTVIGGGPTGVELAGELSDFCHDITQPSKAYPKLAKHIKVVLIHGGPDLLPQFDAELRAEAVRTLEKRGVQVILNTRVTQVKQRAVALSTKVLDKATGQPTGQRTEHELGMGLSVWCAGIAPVPFVDTLLSKLPDEARGVGGRVNVDRWLRPIMPDPSLMGSVMVLGDAASRPSRRRRKTDPQGDDDDLVPILPQTAQVAGQQGAYLARMLTRGYNLTAPVPVLPTRQEGNDKNDEQDIFDPSLAAWLAFRNIERAPGFSFLNLGLLAYLGGGKALTQVQIGDVPVFSYAGSVAFVLWRSVYLVKQVATRNRVLVTFDWIKSALFGRDTTRL